MLRSTTLFLVLVLLLSQIHAQHTDTLLLHFALDDHQLDRDAEQRLKVWCDAFPAGSIEGLHINGHSDVRGNAAYNEQLSLRRARSVQQSLIDHLGQAVPMQVHHRGGYAPRSAARSEADHAMDRRVEVVAYLLAPPVADAVVADLDAHSLLEQLHRHSQVKPLMPLLDLPRGFHTVNANKDIVIHTSDGTTVRIAANSLCDAQGRPVQGEVEISYRGFHEAYGIIASGIPMHIAVDGTTEHFETAGMYELYASQSDQPLGLVNGATIALERPAGPALEEDFTGWRLNEATGAWENGGTLQQAPANSNALRESGTEATRIYWRRLLDIRSRTMPDSLLFEARRRSDEYCGTERCPEQLNDPNAKTRKRAASRMADHSLQVVGHKGIHDPDRVVFEVVMPDRRVFPEWNRMPTKPVWEYTGPEPRKVFKRLYGRRHHYQDIDLVMQPGDTHGVLRLKENGEWLELPVSTAWNRDTPTRAARWDRALASYHKGLAKRSNDFDGMVQRVQRAYDREQDGAVMDSWNQAKRRMLKQERSLDLQAWVSYADSFPLPRGERTAAATQNAFATIRTTFNLEGFGIYNIDRIMKMSNREELFVKALDEEGGTFEWAIGYAVLSGERSVITYWPNGRNEQGTPMLVSPGRMKSLFLVDAEGHIMQMDSEPLNKRRPNTVELRGRLLGAPRDLEELRAQAEP